MTWGGGQWIALEDTDGSVKPDQHTDGREAGVAVVRDARQAGHRGRQGCHGAAGINGRDGREMNQKW